MLSQLCHNLKENRLIFLRKSLVFKTEAQISRKFLFLGHIGAFIEDSLIDF